MSEEAIQEEQGFTLEQLDIKTIGLVHRGAVSLADDGELATGKNFFLLKHDKESSMPDELDIEQVDDTPEQTLSKSDQGLLNKFLTFLKGEAEKVSKPNPQALQQAARILASGGYRVNAADLGEMLGGEDEEEEEDEEMADPSTSPSASSGGTSGRAKGKADSPRKKPGKMEARKSQPEITDEGGTSPVSDETTLTKSLEAQLAEIQKANDARLEAIEKALEEKYKGHIEALEKQAEDAKTEVAKATEARERREWIEKAGEMSLALPVKREELAEHLYAIAKAAPAEVEFITGVLKAADHALTEAGLFSEYGTSRTAEEVEAVEKAEKIAAEKGIPLAEAMLELSPAEQAEIAKSFLEGGN